MLLFWKSNQTLLHNYEQFRNQRKLKVSFSGASITCFGVILGFHVQADNLTLSKPNHKITKTICRSYQTYSPQVGKYINFTVLVHSPFTSSTCEVETICCEVTDINTDDTFTFTEKRIKRVSKYVWDLQEVLVALRSLQNNSKILCEETTAVQKLL